MSYAQRKAARAAIERPERRADQSAELMILRCMTANKFAMSLVSQYDRTGYLSDKQWPWVSKLANEQTHVPAPKLGGFGKVNEVFDLASQTLKYPKIVVQLADDSDLKMSRSGSKSKTPGSVMLTDGGPFGDNVYYGRITDGELILSRDGKARSEELQLLLKSMTSDLASFAKMHGHRTGNCCFCRLELSHASSLEAGYGPICADKYNLPWG